MAKGKKRKNAIRNEVWYRFKKNKAAMLGLIILVVIVAIAVFADLIVPYSKCIEQDGGARLLMPGAAHFFGTDEYGRH